MTNSSKKEKTIKNCRKLMKDNIKQNHNLIYKQLEILVKKLNDRGVDYSLTGSLCVYIKYGIESNRIHDDIDIHLNEYDIDKFCQVCEEMGLKFCDNRYTTPRVLKNGVPVGGHEIIANLDNSCFHIGVFCFERLADGSIKKKGYYHDDLGHIWVKNDNFSLELSKEVFDNEQVIFKGHRLKINPPEYIYMLKQIIQKDKDKIDIEFMKDKIDKEKLRRIKSGKIKTLYEKVLSSNL